MRILGIDPGSRATGWGLIEQEGSRVRVCEWGVVRVSPDGELTARLELLYDRLREILTRLRPEHIAMESIFHAKNARSALVLGHARGCLLLACAHAGVPVFDYAPRTVKQAVTGSGRAEKSQVLLMVRRLLNLDADPPEDASDALAVALTHGAIWPGQQRHSEAS